MGSESLWGEVIGFEYHQLQNATKHMNNILCLSIFLNTRSKPTPPSIIQAGCYLILIQGKWSFKNVFCTELLCCRSLDVKTKTHQEDFQLLVQKHMLMSHVR
jgi:hypothetical protein